MISKKIYTYNKYKEKLSGQVDIPNIKNKKYPTIILTHGFGTDRYEKGIFDDISLFLTKKGFIIYRFDFSGLGKSEGDYSKTTLTKLTEDLASIIKFTKSQKKVDIKNIGIIAMSFSALSSIILNSNEIKSYIFLSSATHNTYKTLSDLFKDYNFNPNGISYRINSEGKNVKIGPKIWQNLKKIDIPRLVPFIKKPALVIHGEKDKNIPLSCAKKFYKLLNKPKKLIIIKGADHGFNDKRKRSEMIKYINNWFNKTLTSLNELK